MNFPKHAPKRWSRLRQVMSWRQTVCHDDRAAHLEPESGAMVPGLPRLGYARTRPAGSW